MSVPSSKIGSLHTLSQASVAYPQDPSGGGGHSFVGEGVEGPNFDNGTEIVVLYVYYNPSTIIPMCTNLSYNKGILHSLLYII